MEALSVLLNKGKISKRMHRFYVMYEISDQGRQHFRETLEDFLLEEPLQYDSESCFGYQVGRTSVWREIKDSIQKVKDCLTEMERESHD